MERYMQMLRGILEEPERQIMDQEARVVRPSVEPMELLAPMVEVILPQMLLLHTVEPEVELADTIQLATIQHQRHPMELLIWEAQVEVEVQATALLELCLEAEVEVDTEPMVTEVKLT